MTRNVGVDDRFGIRRVRNKSNPSNVDMNMRTLNNTTAFVALMTALVALFVFSAVASAAPEEMPKDKSKDKLKLKDKSKDAIDPTQASEPKVKTTSEQRWLLQVKEVLASGDEEWRVLSARVERVINLERDLNAGKDQRGPHEAKQKVYSPDDPRSQPSEALDKARALNAMLLDPQTSAALIRQQIAAVREARARVRLELSAAQEQLRELLTARQEAALIIMGILD